jgi:hypothetical protein
MDEDSIGENRGGEDWTAEERVVEEKAGEVSRSEGRVEEG